MDCPRQADRGVDVGRQLLVGQGPTSRVDSSLQKVPTVRVGSEVGW